MIEWEKTAKTVNADGTTIQYTGKGTNMTIESRKRHIPHAAKGGTWDHTTYWILCDGEEIEERYSLTDAKEYAEKYQEAK